MFDIESYGQIVSFEVYPVVLLGSVFNKCKILSILDYETASLFTDVANLAVSVYPTLPEGTPKDYTKYRYLKLQQPGGDTTIIAFEWINQGTVIIHDDVTLNVRIKVANINTLETVRKIILANNLELIDIVVE